MYDEAGLNSLYREVIMKRVFSYFLMAVLAALSVVPSLANRYSDWNDVVAISNTTQLVVQLKGGNQIKGKKAAADDAAVVLRKDGRDLRIAREEISRVYLGKSGSRGKSALIGAAIGLGIGVGAGVLYERSRNEGDGLAGAAGVLYGVPAGAAIGAIAGGGTKKGTLIYEAP